MLDFLEQDVDIQEYSNFKTSARAEYFYELKYETDV